MTATVEDALKPGPPERTLQQRAAALQKANRVRCTRARVKRLVAAGELDAVAVIGSPAEDVRGMPVLVVLKAVPFIGESKARGILRRAGCSDVKTLGGLSPRQRAAVVAELLR